MLQTHSLQGLPPIHCWWHVMFLCIVVMDPSSMSSSPGVCFVILICDRAFNAESKSAPFSTKYENNVYCWSFSHYCFSSSHSACHLSDWLSHKVVFFDCTDTLLLHSISFSSSWTHLSDDTLAEPNLGIQRRLISYLASTFYAQILHHGQRHGPPDSPSAFKTEFVWVLACEVNHSLLHSSHLSIVAHHAATTLA